MTNVFYDESSSQTETFEFIQYENKFQGVETAFVATSSLQTGQCLE